MFVFNKNVGYLIGIDIGVDYFNGILIDLEGNIIFEKIFDFFSFFVSEVKEILFVFIYDFVIYMFEFFYGLVGIGICVLGFVDCYQ